ncbi:MAG: right-handed parallel beta-helix repeat-containing protein, partial [Anaerolineae bacterium]|nr:right-handed parallel beta-helix repeat-containing protein [Anaerolineae bacterium]
MKTLSISFILLASLLLPVAESTAKTIDVDCAKGQSINSALKDKALDLVVQIHGICNEDVVIARDQVTLLGTDPTVDGIDGNAPDNPAPNAVLRITNARNIRIENLMITGGASSGIGVKNTDRADIVNCRVLDNVKDGLQVSSDSSARVSNTVFSGNGRIGAGAFGGFLSCTNCTVTGGDFGITATNAALVTIDDSN